MAIAGTIRPSSNGHAKKASFPPDADPPHNIDAERSVLAALIIDNNTAPDVLEILSANDFFRDDYQVIFAAIRSIHAAGHPLDVVFVESELKRRGDFARIGGDDTISDILASVPHAVNAKYHAGIVREKSIIRQVIQAANQTILEGYSNGLTSDEVMESARKRLDAIDGGASLEVEAPVVAWPESLEEPAFHGIAGELTRLISPHTEADDAAVLVHILLAFGSMIGRKIHVRVGSSRHYCNLNAVVVGASAKARKGSGADMVLEALKECDAGWRQDRVVDGLSSGEGLISMVADEVRKGDQVVVEGVMDKRLFCVESEFGSLLGILAREGNSLSGVIRKAWDSGRLRCLTKHSPLRATDAHISIVGHVTFEELRSRLSRNDAHNGFANRFLWVCARRSKLLPEGGDLRPVHLERIRGQFRDALEWCRECVECLVRTPEARILWKSIYRDLSRPKTGLLGGVTSRSEAMVLRLSCLYAALDCQAWIDTRHIEAAMAVWRYCERSASVLFGGIHDNPDESRVMEALRAAGPHGLSRATITTSVFQRNLSSERIAEILGNLTAAGLIASHNCSTKGRPAQVWIAKETYDEA